MNVATIVGNLGKAPEIRTSASGKVWCKLQVATHNIFYKDEKKITETEWHSALLFGQAAENAAKYLKKGSKVAISGALKTTKSVDKNGVSHYNTSIMVDVIEYL